MRTLMILPFVALTVLCWGNYGPLMHGGQHGMAGSSLRPFVCVGLAYFLIAVLFPMLYMNGRGESGRWTASGTFWSLVAGAVGAFGALGIIMAFKFYGRPIYVMPLVYGLAPVVNTFVTMLMARTFREARPIFFAGVAIVVLGAAGVMYFKPQKVTTSVGIDTRPDGTIVITPPKGEPWVAKDRAELETNPELRPALEAYRRARGPSPNDMLMVIASIGLTAVSWGSYGPVLHRGQMKMGGSRLRPFMCVGLAYFAIAVVVPMIILQLWDEPGEWMPGGSPSGILWSLAAGSAGALGALGIIMAFNFGGRPIFVMPLVFGCAPVMNTFTTIVSEGTYHLISLPFIVSLCMVILGAVMVLVFAPRHAPPKPAAHGEGSAPGAADADKPAETRDALMGKG